MATGYHDFTAGETLTAANLEDFCMKQSVMIFASAAARNAALAAVLQEGMCAYVLDTNTLTVYSGAAWSTVGPVHGALNPWSPTITQGVTVTYSGSYGSYSRVGRRVHANCRLDVTGAGTASNLVTVTLPVAAVTTGDVVIGAGYLYDLSVTSLTKATVATANSGAAAYMLGSSAGGSFAANAVGSGGTSGFTAGLASGDLISLSLSYEAVADA